MSTDTTSPPATRSAHDYPNVDPKTGRNAEAEAELERLLRLYNTFESDCKFDIQIYGAISDLKSHVNFLACRFHSKNFRMVIDDMSARPVVDRRLHEEKLEQTETIFEKLVVLDGLRLEGKTKEWDFPRYLLATGRNPEAEVAFDRLFRKANVVAPDCDFRVEAFGPIKRIRDHLIAHGATIYGSLTRTIGDPINYDRKGQSARSRAAHTSVMGLTQLWSGVAEEEEESTIV